MKPFPCSLIALLALTWGLLGCQSPAGPHGEVHLGDTPEMVRAEIGRPDQQVNGATGDAKQTTWIYRGFVHRRPEATGWSEVIVPGVQDQNNQVVQESVTREVYTARLKEDLQVVFTAGKVTAVEYVAR